MSQAKLTSQIIKWLKESGNEKYKKSPNLAVALYAEHNKARKISDIMDGMKVKLKVLVIGHTSRDIRLCRGCYSKQCKSSCEKEDYATMQSYQIAVSDEHDKQINLNLAPWYQGEIPEDNHIYLVTGVAKTIDQETGKMEIANVQIIKELDVENFNPVSEEDEEADEDEDDEPAKKKSADDDEDETPKKKSKPAEDEEDDEPKAKPKKQAEDEDEDADEEPKKKSKPKEDDDDDEDEKLAKKSSKADSDPKYEKVKNMMIQFFRATDGARPVKQFRNFIEQHEWTKYSDKIIADLKLKKNDENEYEYVD